MITFPYNGSKGSGWVGGPFGDEPYGPEEQVEKDCHPAVEQTLTTMSGVPAERTAARKEELERAGRKVVARQYRSWPTCDRTGEPLDIYVYTTGSTWRAVLLCNHCLIKGG